jgi:hypothetical protein
MAKLAGQRIMLAWGVSRAVCTPIRHTRGPLPASGPPCFPAAREMLEASFARDTLQARCQSLSFARGLSAGATRRAVLPEHVEMPMPRLVPSMEEGVISKWLVEEGALRVTRSL